MKTGHTLKVILLVSLSFAAYYSLFLNFKPIKLWLDTFTRQGLISYVLTYLIVALPVFAGTILISKKADFLKSLGLLSRPLRAMAISVLFTLPMFLGGLLFFKFDRQVDIQDLIAGTIVAGLMEEVIFRGFLFGQLFRRTELGFIPSIFFGALIFASGHLYQSRDVGELAGIFIVTFSGAVFFAWLYVEWHYALWLPILTHSLMNLSWYLFDASSNAAGDLKANIFRGLTILTAIVFTILYKKHRNEKLSVNRRTLMLKRKERS